MWSLLDTIDDAAQDDSAINRETLVQQMDELIRDVMETIRSRVRCDRLLVTRGRLGCIGFDAASGFSQVPAFALKLVDRIGAGDAVLAATAPCAAQGLSMSVLGFIGNVAGAEACAAMGNQRSLEPQSFFRHVKSLLS